MKKLICHCGEVEAEINIGGDLEKVLSEMAGKEYSFVKNKLADLLVSEICPVGKEINRLMSDKVHLLEILKKGSEKARIIAEENLKNVRDKVGLI